MVDVLTVQPDEEVEQIRARLARARSRQVYLHVPQPNASLRERLSLLQLCRAAENLGLDLTIVTHDSATRVMAGNVHLRTAWRLPDQENGSWEVEGGRWKTEDGERRVESGLVPSAVRHFPLSTFHFPPSILHSPLSLVASTVLLLTLGLALAILIPPAATITVTPATVPLETTLEVVADPDLTAVDVAARRIPARRLAVTLDRQVREPVTGRIDVPGEPAHGTIVFINQGESQVTIPAGSVVSASSEVAVRFRTRRAVTLPGPAGTTARVEIKAVEPGPRGNVPVYAVDVLDPSLGLPVAVVNERALEGGTSRRVSIVTQEEISRVRGALLDRMRREAAQMLEAQVRESERLIDDSLAIQVTDESFSEEVGAIAEAVSIKLTVQAVGLAIDEEQVRQLAAAGLGRQVPAEQVLVDGSFEFDIRSMAADEGGAARVRVEAVAMAQARVGKSDVKDVVRGRPVGEVPALLRERLPIEGAPVVNVSRAWLGRMPWLPVRIDVVISEP